MKVLHINDLYSHGGAEKYVREIHSELKKDEEFESIFVPVISSEKESLFERNEGIITKIKNRFGTNKQIENNLRETITEENPDIVHIHRNTVSPISIHKAISNYEGKTIKTIHNYGYIEPAERFEYQNKIKTNLRLLIEKYKNYRLKNYKKQIDIFISPSKILKNQIKNTKTYPKVKHLYNFAENPKKPPKDGGNYYLYAGRLSKDKNPKMIIEALGNTKHKLKICGKGPQKQEIEQIIQKNNYQNITLEGHQENLANYYRNAKALIVPSKVKEMNGLVNFEAMSYGTPIITTQKGELKEINEFKTFFHNKKTLLETIEKYEKDQDKFKFSKKAYKLYQNKYNKQKHLKNLKKIYKS